MTGLDGLTDLLDYPMYVVTTTAPDGERAGCLVGFASQCSIDPPRFVVWLSRENHTYQVACRGGHLAVHVLSPEQRATARLFGEETGDLVDKFARASSVSACAGAPVLTDALAWFVGRVEARLDGGDHVGFLLAPVAESPPGHPWAGRLLRLSDVTDFSPGHPA
ncbi:flavin reductase family protein [Streptomyces sp. Je 1-79]|uniref:flavin reductase family protein n=1 Tax=Streptomyces sp. Je 1-79 TaxID=2943847 RepID=UPI0021A78BB4|nr:flavin reductase family protein [Streptomyces sp. Je 1-79]MCT4353089.1 flavin reductase family protein [Streptomyces sp. Je 1-79]